MKHILIISLWLIWTIGSAQENSAKSNKEGEPEKDSLSNKINKLEKQIASLYEKTNIGEDDTVGFFILNKDTITQYTLIPIYKESKLLKQKKVSSYDSKNSGVLHISKIHIHMNEALISGIKVYTAEKKIFEIKQIQVTPSELNYRGNKLFCLSNPNEYIFLNNLISYDSREEGEYINQESLIVLTTKYENKPITISSKLNSYLDIRTYSDIFGLINKESNGIVQTEICSKFYYNYYPIAKYYFLVNYFEPFINYSKFDSQYGSQILYPDSLGMYYVNKLKFNQLSYLTLGVKINLLRIKIPQIDCDLLNVGLDYKFSDIIRYNNQTKETLTANGIFFETKLNIKQTKRFEFSISQKIYTQKIHQLIYPFDEIYFIYSFNTSFLPKQDSNGAIFLRFIYFSDLYTNFQQFQVGYRTKLNFNRRKN